MFEFRIDTGNSAFDSCPASEIARILRTLADDVEKSAPVSLNRREDGVIRDANDNRIGGWSFRAARI